MTDRPIIFSAPMIRALLDGRKTMTRRVISKKAALDALDVFGSRFLLQPGNVDLIRYAPGDRLWVRENCHAKELPAGNDGVRYAADGMWLPIENIAEAAEKWGKLFYYRGRGKNGIGNNVPSIHMPRWASRLTLTVTDVRVERLQAISEEDAQAEGVNRHSRKVRQFWLFGADQAQRDRIYLQACKWEFEDIWNSLHGPDAWDANPWVVAITFEVRKGNIDDAKLAEAQ